jgi:hypothetical protein
LILSSTLAQALLLLPSLLIRIKQEARSQPPKVSLKEEFLSCRDWKNLKADQNIKQLRTQVKMITMS